MINSNQQASVTKKGHLSGKERSYSEVIEYIESKWSTPLDKTLKRFKQIDKILGGITKSVPTILVAGSNGKSLTANFIVKLLKEEGLKVGTMYSPHILTYNERVAIDGESINNKVFTDAANSIINTLEQEKIDANASEILTAMSMFVFKESKTDVGILEVNEMGAWDPTVISDAKVVAITRVTSSNMDLEDASFKKMVKDVSEIAGKGSHVISADQSKMNLKTIQEVVSKKGASWAMPIRKLAALPYPYEQLHGRCAALAERAAQIFMENFAAKNAVVITKSLLVKPKGQRGRPSLEAKRQSELNPKKTLDQFWKDNLTSLSGRFQVLDKEKPTLLLDSANNIDALENTLLGVRLLHYQKPLQGLAIIVGCENNDIHNADFLRQIRYFFKKTSGQIIFCPTKPRKDVLSAEWDYESFTNDVKNVKVKAHSAKNFNEAFELAKKSVDEKYGLVVITGSKSIIAEYWENKGIKKF